MVALIWQMMGVIARLEAGRWAGTHNVIHLNLTFSRTEREREEKCKVWDLVWLVIYSLAKWYLSLHNFFLSLLLLIRCIFSLSQAFFFKTILCSIIKNQRYNLRTVHYIFPMHLCSQVVCKQCLLQLGWSYCYIQSPKHRSDKLQLSRWTQTSMNSPFHWPASPGHCTVTQIRLKI